MTAMVATMGLASVAAVTSVNSQRGVVRDQDTKAALAAAEAGVSEALLHYNRISTAPGLPCLVGTPLASDAPNASGWCDPVTRSMAGIDGGSFTYWVKPTAGQIEIVSSGNVSGVSRSVDVVARSSAGLQPFSGFASVIGLDFITMSSNGRIAANVATNGDITMNSNAELTCDYARVGVGRTVYTYSNAHYSCPSPDHGTTSLPPVNQGNVVTNNSNGRFFSNTGANPGDVISGSGGGCGAGWVGTRKVCWLPSQRYLRLDSNSTLTMGGSNYSVCRVELNSNTRIYIASGATVRFYFDSPEACGLPANAVQLDLDSNSRISVTGGTATHVAFLFVGSDTRRTRVELSSNTEVDQACEQDFVIYGPRTDILLNSNSFFCGAMAGKSITLDSDADIKTNNNAGGFVLPNTVAQHYALEDFIECSAPTGPLPDAGC